METCKHSNCAICVSNSKKEREVLKKVLKRLHPEIYICKHVFYKITNNYGQEFILSSLEQVAEGKKGYFVKDMYTSEIIYLRKENVEVICSIAAGEECKGEPYVLEYIPKHTKAAD